MPKFTLVLVVAALVLGACGSTLAEGELPPSTTLPPASEPLVAFEASWLCQVQRFAYTDISEIETQQRRALEGAGFSSADYADFEVRLEEDADLRAEVKDRFVTGCAAVEVTGEDPAS